MAWPTLTTGRLLLRPLTMDDLDDLAALHAEESFWHFPFGRAWTTSETETFLERTLARYRDPGIAVSAVEIADTGDLAGWAGLSIPTFLPEILPAVEVGWRLGEKYRGRGFATEAGAAWVRYGFDELELTSIVSIYEPENLASELVMQRLGFTPEREAMHPTHHVRLHVMSLARDEWRRSSPRDVV